MTLKTCSVLHRINILIISFLYNFFSSKLDKTRTKVIHKNVSQGCKAKTCCDEDKEEETPDPDENFILKKSPCIS